MRGRAAAFDLLADQVLAEWVKLPTYTGQKS